MPESVIQGIVCTWIIVLCYLTCNSVNAQHTRIDSINYIDSVLLLIKTDKETDTQSAIGLADSIFIISQALGDTCRQIQIKVSQAADLDAIGEPEAALDNLYWAQSVFPNHCDSSLFLDLQLNLSSLLITINDFAGCDSICRKALDVLDLNPIYSEMRFDFLNNLAISQIYRGDLGNALKTFRVQYYEAVALNNTDIIVKASTNLGTLHAIAESWDSSRYYLQKGVDYARLDTNEAVLRTAMLGLANIDAELGFYERAFTMMDSVDRMAVRDGDMQMHIHVLSAIARLFSQQGNFELAYQYAIANKEANDSFLNEQRLKSIAEMSQKYEAEKRTRQIQQLELEKLDIELENTRVTGARNRLLYGGIVVVLIAVGLWSRLRYVRKSQIAIRKEKDLSDRLLLNILPASVAEELKHKGNADAKLFEKGTILFSDFEGFTPAASRLSAEELVAELNVYFKEFDAIATKYGIEKIKTIGDAYMAAAGIPDTNRATAKEMILAALEMQKFVLNNQSGRGDSDPPAFKMRIGIHTGPVVAGIVGVKKFQYDLWGDTVNIASRMESNGHIGKVNISEATYNLVKDDPDFKFVPRGLVQVKGKGQLKMYFVDVATNQ